MPSAKRCLPMKGLPTQPAQACQNLRPNDSGRSLETAEASADRFQGQDRQEVERRDSILWHPKDILFIMCFKPRFDGRAE